ncbi:MAG: NAD(P)/FAD-dependent oxidoreductase [Saprospiraceae bacterium]
MTKNIIIIGGGAAGFFAAITCAETDPLAKVVILEKGNQVLQKVKVSGGGRCNVTHACFEPRELVKNYPRGSKALLGPFNQFAPGDTISWFYDRGVELKTEDDGRMFPTTDDSQTIIDCLMTTAIKAGVKVLTNHNVVSISKSKEWEIETQKGDIFHAGKLMIAAGCSPRLWNLLKEMGHQIVEPVPSLFTFNINDERIKGLPGLSVSLATVKIVGEKLEASGPLLITHWGMSGPAILKLSAWGARTFHERNYAFEISINWLGNENFDDALASLKNAKMEHAKKLVVNFNPFTVIPKRLWESLLQAASVNAQLRWADISKSQINKLAMELTSGIYQVRGKSTFKEEFVTAGGIHLDEVNFRRFESKIIPNLFFAGEILDIDAVTGGFNFQAAWTGGKIAGTAMSED